MSRQPTLLFVDDDPGLLEGIRRSLRKHPYRLMFAASGAEALTLLGAQSVDVVVSDHDMPGMRGTELLEQVSRRWPTTVRILLTGRPSYETAIEAVNRGEIYRFLVKPCDVQDLVLALNQGLERRDLLLGAQSLITKVRQQENMMRDLEAAHPGITATQRDGDGAIVLDESAAEVDELFLKFQSLVDKAMRVSRDA